MKRALRRIAAIFILSTIFMACSDRSGAVNDDKPAVEEPPVEEPVARESLIALINRLVTEQNGERPRKKVFIVAHRANTLKASQENVPENSIENIELAIAAGADMVELDVRPTKDGVLVLMHDESIDRTTNGKGKVADLTYEQILQYDLKRGSVVSKGMKVPTLEEALAACKDKIYVNLDLANKNVPVRKCMKALEELDMADQVMIYSGKAELLQYVAVDPRIIIHPYVHKVSDAAAYRQYPTARLFQYSYLYYLGDDVDFAKNMRAQHFLTYSNLLNTDKEILNGDYSSLTKFIASETDFIQTDYAELVHAYLDERSLR